MAGRRHGEGKEKGKGIESKFLHIALMNSIETPKRGEGTESADIQSQTKQLRFIK